MLMTPPTLLICFSKTTLLGSARGANARALFYFEHLSRIFYVALLPFFLLQKFKKTIRTIGSLAQAYSIAPQIDFL